MEISARDLKEVMREDPDLAELTRSTIVPFCEDKRKKKNRSQHR